MHVGLEVERLRAVFWEDAIVADLAFAFPLGMLGVGEHHVSRLRFENDIGRRFLITGAGPASWRFFRRRRLRFCFFAARGRSLAAAWSFSRRMRRFCRRLGYNGTTSGGLLFVRRLRFL